MSRRTERVAHRIRDILSRAIPKRLSDPRIAMLTSITRVEVSPDFSIARINVSVMAPPAQQKLTVDALRSAAGRLRGEVAEGLTLRVIPRLEFHLDLSIQRAMETLRALDAVLPADAEPASPESPPAAAIAGPDQHPPEDS